MIIFESLDQLEVAVFGALLNDHCEDVEFHGDSELLKSGWYEGDMFDISYILGEQFQYDCPQGLHAVAGMTSNSLAKTMWDKGYVNKMPEITHNYRGVEELVAKLHFTAKGEFYASGVLRSFFEEEGVVIKETTD